MKLIKVKVNYIFNNKIFYLSNKYNNIKSK